MVAMKKKLGIFVTALLGLGMLAGCQNSTKLYYTINVYSDYTGMEEYYASHGYYAYEGTDSIKIGYCYALPEGEAKTGGINVYDYSGKTYDYRKAVRTAPNGYHYEFDKLVGFYSKDKNKPIDLKKITGDCVVFSTFKLVPNKCNVTVKDAFADAMYSGIANFDSKGSDEANADLKAALLDFPVYDRAADPADPTTWRAPYYNVYTPKDWKVTITDSDNTKHTENIGRTEEAINAYVIKGNSSFEPTYDVTLKQFHVHVDDIQLRTPKLSASGDIEYDYETWAGGSAMPRDLDVDYGTSIREITEFTGMGFSLVAEGKNGVRTTYAKGEGFPRDLIDPRTQAPMHVDINFIRYDCSITLVYEKMATHYTVTFNDTVGVDPVTVIEGAAVTAPGPSKVNAPVDQTYTGLWKKNGSTEIYDLDAIYETVALDPVCVPTTVVYQKDPSSPTITYTYEYSIKGYAVTSIDVAGTDPIAITKDMFKPAEDFPAYAPYLGLDAFGEDRVLIKSLELPAATTYITHGALTRLDVVESIDLTATALEAVDGLAFENLPRLQAVRLPGTLKEVKGKLFPNCTSLTTVYLDMTVAQYEEVSASFASDWNCGHTVTYKAAE